VVKYLQRLDRKPSITVESGDVVVYVQGIINISADITE